MSICLHNGFVLWNAWLQQTWFICCVSQRTPEKCKWTIPLVLLYVCMYSWLLSQQDFRLPIFTFVKIQRNMVHVHPVLTNTQDCNISEDMPYIVNLLTPNNDYSGHTALLTSKCCILYIYSTNISTKYFKCGIYSAFFPLQNAVCFINLMYLVSVLFTFYIQGVLKLKKIIPAPKG